MRYAIADVEVTQRLPGLALADDESGLALLLRRNDRPFHFSLHALPAGARLAPEEIATLIAEVAGIALLEEGVREELAQPSAPPTPVSLTVAICTRARPDVLSGCLRSVLEIRPDDASDPRFFQLLVVDNDPSDSKTEEVVASLRDVDYVREQLPGLDFARNRAVAEARGEYIAFLDDDVVVDRGWLAGLEEALAENPDAAAVTGLVLPFELVSEAQLVFERRGGFRRGFQKLRYAGQTMPGNPLYPTGAGIFGAGCNMILRRAVLLELGGFDEALAVAYNDVDFCLRAREKGYLIVYTPHAVLRHESGGSRGMDGAQPPEDRSRFRERWGGYRDPYYSPNFDIERPFKLELEW